MTKKSKQKMYSLKPKNSKVKLRGGGTGYKVSTLVNGKIVKRIVTIPD